VTTSGKYDRFDAGGKKRMLRMDQYEYIRIAHRVYEKGIREIERDTGHSRNTIRKALKGELQSYSKRGRQPFPVLGPYLGVIDKWLEEDKERPSKQRHTAKRIFDRLRIEHGFAGAESTIRHYVREAKARIGTGGMKVYLPLDPAVGEEAEVDWGSAIAVIGGEQTGLKFFCMRSKYSGKHFVRLYPCERQQAFFDGHMEAFRFFGGVFPVLIYDNLTTAVQRVLRGKDLVEQEAFGRFHAYYNFNARFCNPGSGNEKGGVEGLVGFSRRNYMVPVPEAQSLEELNERLLSSCLIYGSHRIKGREKTVSELFEEERSHLITLPEAPFSNIETLSVKADSYATVRVDKNRYSVPTRLAGMRVQVLVGVDRVELYYEGKRVASHARVFGNNKWRLDPDHYLELLQQRPQAFESARPVREWRKGWPESFEKLLVKFKASQGETRGIKDFISVLLLYRDYPARDIEAAVELGVESGIGSSAGIKHLLEHSEAQPGFAPLRDWPETPPTDISVYAELGGVP
jgi:transposase